MVLETARFEPVATADKTENIESWRGGLRENSKPIARHEVYKKFSLIYNAAQQIALAHWNSDSNSEGRQWQAEDIRVTDIFYQQLIGRDNGDGEFEGTNTNSDGLLVISTPTERPRKGEKRRIISTLYVPKTTDQQNLLIAEAYKDKRLLWDRVGLGVPEIDQGEIVEVYNASLKGKRRSLRSLRVYQTDELYTENYGFQSITLAKVVDIDLMEDFLEAQKIIDRQDLRAVSIAEYQDTNNQDFNELQEQDYSHHFSRADSLLDGLHNRLNYRRNLREKLLDGLLNSLNYYRKKDDRFHYVDKALSLIRKADLSKLVEIKESIEGQVGPKESARRKSPKSKGK